MPKLGQNTLIKLEKLALIYGYAGNDYSSSCINSTKLDGTCTTLLRQFQSNNSKVSWTKNSYVPTSPSRPSKEALPTGP